MDNLYRMKNEMAYRADEEIISLVLKARKLTQRYNSLDCDDFDGMREILNELLGAHGERCMFTQPFRCDLGFNIFVGEDFHANYNCTVLDVGRVTIGNNVMFGPNVSIFTAGHPLHPEIRNSGYEYGIPVTIGDNVWIGGNTTILPGVTIGEGCVIGAGSVVTKDIPDNVVAAGNPARVLRTIGEADRQYLYKDRKFDDEAWESIK